MYFLLLSLQLRARLCVIDRKDETKRRGWRERRKPWTVRARRRRQSRWRGTRRASCGVGPAAAAQQCFILFPASLLFCGGRVRPGPDVPTRPRWTQRRRAAREMLADRRKWSGRVGTRRRAKSFAHSSGVNRVAESRIPRRRKCGAGAARPPYTAPRRAPPRPAALHVGWATRRFRLARGVPSLWGYSAGCCQSALYPPADGFCGTRPG